MKNEKVLLPLIIALAVFMALFPPVSPEEERLNLQPICDAAAGPYTGTAGVPLSFDGSASFDPDGTIVSYNWDFGDGGTGTGITPIHTYSEPGFYNVALVIHSDSLEMVECDAEVDIRDPLPEIEITTNEPKFRTSDRLDIGLSVTNPGEAAVLDILIILERPLCVNDNRFDLLENRKSVRLPSGYDFNNPTWKSLILPPIHWGDYTLLAFIKDPVTGKTISHSKATFSFGGYNEEEARISLKDLGVLQLAAHDLFNINRTIEVNFENGKLDLSTLFKDTLTGDDFGPEDIAQGGEVRNRENIILFTVASQLGQKYLKLEEEFGEEEAYKEIIKIYHELLKKAYENTFTEKFPKPMDGDATMTENLAFRTVHDFLPGKIDVDGERISTLDPSLHGKTLSKEELKQMSSPLDGEFDPEFLAINIFIPPSTFIVVNLLEADSTFATQFGTEFTFEQYLKEVSDGKFNKNEDVMKQIRNLIAKGQNF
jgi:hypothetical protein